MQRCIWIVNTTFTAQSQRGRKKAPQRSYRSDHSNGHTNVAHLCDLGLHPFGLASATVLTNDAEQVLRTSGRAYTTGAQACQQLAREKCKGGLIS